MLSFSFFGLKNSRLGETKTMCSLASVRARCPAKGGDLAQMFPFYLLRWILFSLLLRC